MLIKLRVRPDSKKNAAAKKAPDPCEVRVKTPAERGFANRAVLEAMGKAAIIEAPL